MIGLLDVSALADGFVLHSLALLVLWMLFWLAPSFVLAATANYLVSLPLRRQERARFFLDLLETALQRGGSVEETLVSISESRDRGPGVRFHLLAAHLSNGMRLGQALEKVPRLLPPKVSAMLRVGEKIGDLRKVLPACRQLVGDALSQTRGAMHYLLWLGFVFTPLSILIFSVLTVKVVPQFKLILESMTDVSSPWFAFLTRYQGLIFGIPISLLILFFLAAIFYLGGPRLTSGLQRGLPPFLDWVGCRIPWKRKRIQRDFSRMLAILLDAELPEAQAVRLAADCTTNEIFKRRAEHVAANLSQGVGLTEAVQALDDSGEFRWRLTNASHARTGFLRALDGWCESLDAKAFQQEQAAAQIVTSALVVINGVFVGLIAVGVFGSLISVIEAGVLW